MDRRSFLWLLALVAIPLGAQASRKIGVIVPGARLVRTFNSWGYTTLAREANRAAPRMAMPVGELRQALNLGP